MKTDLGYPQYLQFMTYLDCKRRTKKQIDFPSDEKGHKTADEKLVRFLLANSSITEDKNERAFQRVCSAVDVMCKQLCPGQWCTRAHCKNYDSSGAYNCSKTRPAVCKEYKKYIEGVEERKNRRYLILSTKIDDYVGCCSADHRLSYGEKRVRCYGDCAGCESLSNKQIKPNKL